MNKVESAIIWKEIKQNMRANTTQLSYDTWIEPLCIRQVDEEKSMVILVWPEQKELVHHIRDHYRTQLESEFQRVTGENYEVVIQHINDAADSDWQGLEQMNQTAFTGLHLNKEYTFDNFYYNNTFPALVAPSAAKVVAESPLREYNPLVLCGESGVGKTHLLHAIGNEVTNKTNAIVCLLSADAFIYQYDEAREMGNVDSFMAEMEQADYLLVDDVQNIRSMEHQRAFIFVLDTFLSKCKAFVMTCDDFPEYIWWISYSMKERLRMGLLTKLEAPDYATRRKILADTLHKTVENQIDGTKKMIDIIASMDKLSPKEAKIIIKEIETISTITGHTVIGTELINKFIKDVSLI